MIKWLALNGPEGTALPNAPAASGAGVRIEIAGDDDEAKMKAQREADVEAKRSGILNSAICLADRSFRDRTQNQLPSWIAQSTVNGDSTTSQLETLAAAELAAKRSREIKPSQHDIAATDSSTADFDSYYATLEAAGEPTEEDEVIIETPILSSLRNSATPGSSSATVTPKLEVLSDDEYDTIAVKVEPDLLESVENGNGKRSRDTADDEWDDTASGLEEVAKKARVDSAALSEGAPNEEDDEDDFEFDEGEGADQNTNPMISVAGKLLPFAEVKGSDELTAAMVCRSLSSHRIRLLIEVRCCRLQTNTSYALSVLSRRSSADCAISAGFLGCLSTHWIIRDWIFVYFVLASSFGIQSMAHSSSLRLRNDRTKSRRIVFYFLFSYQNVVAISSSLWQ